MRASKWALATLLLCVVEGRAAITAVTSGVIDARGALSAYVDLDTTGANLVVAQCGYDSWSTYGAAATVSDSNGLVWHVQSLVGDPIANVQWAASNTVGKFGTAHRITLTFARQSGNMGGGCYVKAYSGADATGSNGINALEREITGVTGSGATITISGTPSSANELVVNGMAQIYGGGASSITSGTLSYVGSLAGGGGYVAGFGMADLIQASPVAASVTWANATGGGVNLTGATMVFFKAAAATGRKLTVITGGE